MSQLSLLRLALAERENYGFIRTGTREALEDIGMTSAQIESALTQMETNNG